jgi:hypothetical protein
MGTRTRCEIANYSVTETLRDGTAILIRAIRPNDKQRLVEHFQGLSLQSIYNRFFGLKRSLGDDDHSRYSDADLVEMFEQVCGIFINAIRTGAFKLVLSVSAG